MIYLVPAGRKRKAPIIVHVGNAGLNYRASERNFPAWNIPRLRENEIPFEKTKRLVSRMVPKMGLMKFIGLDLGEVKQKEPDKKLWEQRQIDAVKGLEKMKDKSVSMISSDMTIGYYNEVMRDPHSIALWWSSSGYAQKFFQIAKEKLKKKGVVHIVVDSSRITMIRDAAIEAGFKEDNISISNVNPKNKNTTFWSRAWPKMHGVPKLSKTGLNEGIAKVLYNRSKSLVTMVRIRIQN